uniref:Uncharacterized protein n=1 Tax=Meloidogyne enterolobii TaxID=390850 RepID=A0A6V7WXM1_MELEN|nr:unnamed protein product [Meloidogyne enterolobii]
MLLYLNKSRRESNSVGSLDYCTKNCAAVAVTIKNLHQKITEVFL